tara:strand:+ start:46 stop:264 length:219 start_codon:yes stop_codon:yes gene_type:complete
MDISESLRDPFGAALIAGCVTAGYIHAKAQMNNEGKLELSSYTKPALLNAIMVYFIVSAGIGAREKISVDPY